MKGSTAEISCDVIPHNLIKATPKTIQRFVMVTSAGVERVDEIPFNILNSFSELPQHRGSNGSHHCGGAHALHRKWAWIDFRIE